MLLWVNVSFINTSSSWWHTVFNVQLCTCIYIPARSKTITYQIWSSAYLCLCFTMLMIYRINYQTELRDIMRLLFSVVVYHHGKKATGGHYTTAVFHPAINNWIIIDDSLVKHVSVGTVLKNIPGRVPYLLYYRRIDMH